MNCTSLQMQEPIQREITSEFYPSAIPQRWYGLSIRIVALCHWRLIPALGQHPLRSCIAFGQTAQHTL